MPSVSQQELDAITLAETTALRTKEELVQETKVVREAKLEDLLRRGTPADLRAANELMKVMEPATYSSVDSRIDDELRQFENKISLLDELVESYDRADPQSRQTVKTLYLECKAEFPKLFRLANSDLREDSMSRLLNMSEILNMLVKRIEDTRPSQPERPEELLIDFGQNTSTIELASPIEEEHVLQQSSKQTARLSPEVRDAFQELDVLGLDDGPATDYGADLAPLQKLVGWNQHILVDKILSDDSAHLRVMNLCTAPISDLRVVRRSHGPSDSLLSSSLAPKDTACQSLSKADSCSESELILEYLYMNKKHTFLGNVQ